jgi:PBP1b-binding outer membrane lipoprotein LpoB
MKMQYFPVMLPIRKQHRSLLLLLVAGCMISLTGCGKDGENGVAEVQGKSPAPAASVDTKSLPTQERAVVENAAAQGKYETSRASQQGSAYMEAMKRAQNR